MASLSTATHTQPAVPTSEPRRTRAFPHVLVIGAGISGILTGIKLREHGIDSFTILEKAASLGGTWRDNTYPGVACDDPAHLYVYSFAPNPDWTHRFAGGADILGYYRRTAAKYDINRHIRYGTEVTDLRWKADHWDVTTSTGDRLRADVVICAVGRLHHPSIPDIPGLDTFSGPVFHSAAWRHDVPVEGRRVGVVGTGSSATQITTALSNTAGRLVLFQRTPQWVLTVPNEPIPRWMRTAFKHLPFAGRWYYRHLCRETAKATRILTRGDRSEYNQRAKDSLSSVTDPLLREKLTPDYAPGCKRMVNSPAFYRAVQGPRIELVDGSVDHVEPRGVVDAHGRLHELDVLVLATGFQTQAFLRPMTVTGQDGVTLDTLWRRRFTTYRSVALPSMPNLFVINGPYTPASSGSVVPVLEIDVDYVMQCVDTIRAEGVSLTPRQERSDQWVEEVRSRASKTVWVTGGCHSWYLDKDGVPVNNPATRAEFARDLKAPRYEDFDVRPLTPTVSRSAKSSTNA